MRSAAEPAAGPNTRWIESLSPWPEEFGLERMKALLRELGDPQRRYPAIHVVGTNGKSTTTRFIAALLRAEGVRDVGSYISPHVRAWSERIQINDVDVDFEAVIGQVRASAERVGATQFETITAAALAAFAQARVDVAVVEAGLGGRLDATNVLETQVVTLTNVSLEHTDVLGLSREAIAREKLAVIRAGCTVVLGEGEEWEELALELGAGRVVPVADRWQTNDEVSIAGVEAFLGRETDSALWFVLHEDEVDLPGRFEIRSDRPLEVWDGAHNPAAAARLAREPFGVPALKWLSAWHSGDPLPQRDVVKVVSVMSDKDVDGILRGLTPLGPMLIATSASTPRALKAEELAERARPYYEHVEVVPDPRLALARARELAGPDGAVLVTGSLYLLADLHSVP